MGELCPSPRGLRQRTLGASFHRLTVSREEPSRRGPSHCGQSSADATLQKRTRRARERSCGIVVSSNEPKTRARVLLSPTRKRGNPHSSLALRAKGWFRK